MNTQDEKIRSAVNDAFTKGGIDVRNLMIESFDGRLVITGSVPTIEQQDALITALKARFDGVESLECDVSLRRVAPSERAGSSVPNGSGKASGHSGNG